MILIGCSETKHLHMGIQSPPSDQASKAKRVVTRLVNAAVDLFATANVEETVFVFISPQSQTLLNWYFVCMLQ